MHRSKLSKGILNCLHDAHLESKTPNVTKLGKGKTYTIFPDPENAWQNIFEIKLRLIKKRIKQHENLMFVLQTHIDKGYIETKSDGMIEQKYKLTHIGFEYLSQRNSIRLNWNLIQVLIGIIGIILAYMALK